MPTTSTKLAINGGPKSIADDIIFRRWPEITKEDEELVLASLRQDSHAFGPHAQMLQEEMAAWNGNKHVMATNAGTAALHMCVAGCGCGPGDEVITTALSWTSSATCIIHHNALPVFVDVSWDDMLIDPAKIEAAITEKTKAILVVHYFGVACDMGRILDIAKKHKLKVIEDACQAHGATWQGKKVGTIGDCGAFSLNQNKNHCGGEGGFFVTDNEAIFTRGKALSAFSDMRPADSGRDYDDFGLGWMYRTSDLPAAFALSQLRKLTRTNDEARANWHQLDDLLEGTPNLIRPYSSDERPTNGYAYVLRTDPAYATQRGVGLMALTRGVREALAAEGANMSHANWLLPAHSVFQAKNAYGRGYPWSDVNAREDINYDCDQYPVGQQCIDTCLWGINNHRPPNGEKEIKALAGAIRKVYEGLDDVPVTE